ncbi:hypothetical protein JW766_02055 [Candidatus Dojkabacteria bacterium]|nr:hypothetical protein [Candidatus Dojkabacteria bacterium]
MNRIRLKFYKLRLFLLTLNNQLPKLLRVTRWGIITTILSLVLSVSVVFAQDDESRANLDTFSEYQLTYMLKNLAIGTGPQRYSASGQTTTGATYYLNSLMGEIYEETDQVSAVAYVQDTLEDAHLVQPAYAQASGYTMLNPILELWKKIRNVSLAIIVVVGLILAIMILFRVRSGQGYVSVLNALPKMLVAILLIVFSYSIGGLMLDLTTLGTKGVLAFFLDERFVNLDHVQNINEYPATMLNSSGEIAQEGDAPVEGLADYNIFRLMSVLVSFDSWGHYDCDPSDPDPYMPWKDISGHPWQDQCGLQIRDIIATPTNVRMLDFGIKVTGSGIGEWGLTLIFNVFILMIVFKVFFALVGAFAQIILRVLIAPIQFMFVPIRGLETVTSWLKSVIAQVLVFPGTMLMLLIAALLGNYFGAPPYWINNDAIDLFKDAPYMLTHSVQPGGLNFLGRIIAIIIVSQIPNLPKLIEQALQVTAGPDVGAELGQRLKAAAAKIPVLGGIVNWLT